MDRHPLIIGRPKRKLDIYFHAAHASLTGSSAVRARIGCVESIGIMLRAQHRGEGVSSAKFGDHRMMPDTFCRRCVLTHWMKVQMNWRIQLP
jgi:hypothetical protein